MINPQEIDWSVAEGVSYSVSEIQAALSDLSAGKLSDEEQIDLMVEFVRDGRATTAGYAVIPILLSGSAPDARTAWLMAHFACWVIGLSGQEGNPPVPEVLFPNVNGESRKVALQTLFRSMSEVDLKAAELLDSMSSALAVLERPDLSEPISEMALREYGSGVPS